MIILIPARLASVRLSRKPLEDIRGKPMIIHAMERAQEAQIGRVIVACCGHEIADLVKQHGGEAVITDPALSSGTDRIAAALHHIDPKKEHDLVVNLQGDLPFIRSDDIKKILNPFQDEAVHMSTLVAPIPSTDTQQINNPSVVKVALSPRGDFYRCLYFSRQPIPDQAETYYHHIGIYGYRRNALERFIALPCSFLEKTERLEQLRALEDGMRIDAALVHDIPQSVDTPEDLALLRRGT